jgi:hypothetical protein
VGDDQDRLLGSLEDALEPAAEPADGIDPVLSTAGNVRGGPVAPEPLPELGDVPAFQVADPRVVQLRHDEARDVASLEGDVGGLPRARELGDDTEIHIRVRENAAEAPRFLPASIGEPDGT